jgi:hypothetical protein
MTNHTAHTDPMPAPARRRLLKHAARGWFIATALGQLLFVLFIQLFYYRLILAGNFAGWNAKPLITGYVAGDDIGNGQFALHVMFAAIMTLAGLIQLLPAVRMRWPQLHRWSGRIFLITALILSLGGLWLTWVRGSYLTVTSAVAISIDALLILWFGTMAWRTARTRNLAAHRRWALRCFVAASGVWLMRVGYMAWGIATGGAGIATGMAGPFDLVWGFATYLLPLAMLELYLAATRAASGRQIAVGLAMMFGSVLILMGSVGAWLFMWLPHL